MVILENSIQDQLGTLLHVFRGLALRGPRDIFLWKTFFKDNVGELGLYLRLRPTLVAAVCAIVFTAVLGQEACESTRKKTRVILPRV